MKFPVCKNALKYVCDQQRSIPYHAVGAYGVTGYPKLWFWKHLENSEFFFYRVCQKMTQLVFVRNLYQIC